MDVVTWLSFMAASAIIIAMPGPTVLYLIGQTASCGTRETLKLVPAVALGVCASISASLAGAGVVLLASATLFTTPKVAGGIYPIWPGFCTIRDKADVSTRKTKKRMRHRFMTALAISPLNPKVLVFYVAFLPQFVDPIGPVLVQFLILTVSFTALAAINAVVWISIVGQLSIRIAFGRVTFWLNRISGGLLILAGLYTFKPMRT
ncbi:LysE family translocator [uncultured Roseobacter sp.]|uniref:LysE family translocator n=1 Tax=uncultured Roseobacter sp. TaxID=114847 RepID=UPI00260E9B76|nr:LysE family translocator [uncultured Roseobacter sp.]